MLRRRRSVWISLIALTTLALGSATARAQRRLPPRTFDEVASAVVRIEATLCAAEPRERASNGFILDHDGDRYIVTTLHSVSGCAKIDVRRRSTASGGAGWTPSESVLKRRVSRTSDLALLQVPSGWTNAGALRLAAGVPANGRLAAVGFFWSSLAVGEIPLDLVNTTGETLDDALGPSVADVLLEEGVEFLGMKVDRYSGDLVPGASGAPIVAANGRVVGVAQGGLARGTIGSSWGIPLGPVRTILAQSQRGSEAGAGQSTLLYKLVFSETLPDEIGRRLRRRFALGLHYARHPIASAHVRQLAGVQGSLFAPLAVLPDRDHLFGARLELSVSYSHERVEWRDPAGTALDDHSLASVVVGVTAGAGLRLWQLGELAVGIELGAGAAILFPANPPPQSQIDTTWMVHGELRVRLTPAMLPVGLELSAGPAYAPSFAQTYTTLGAPPVRADHRVLGWGRLALFYEL